MVGEVWKARCSVLERPRKEDWCKFTVILGYIVNFKLVRKAAKNSLKRLKKERKERRKEG